MRVKKFMFMFMNTTFLAYLIHRGGGFQTKSESLLYEYPGPTEVTGGRGRRRKQLLGNLRRYIIGNWKKH